MEAYEAIRAERDEVADVIELLAKREVTAAAHRVSEMDQNWVSVGPLRELLTTIVVGSRSPVKDSVNPSPRHSDRLRRYRLQREKIIGNMASASPPRLPSRSHSPPTG
eukprot:TRINITY_DN13858_c0_g1_i1.p1 TRINITY_DN13858_c0_g1~~TRINITY_DN13858_c0_g1_i1.p1  ORF type:complete len:122 (+),score=4.69 TRINITY_DN13858_c0_g1_i1:45-368(+)